MLKPLYQQHNIDIKDDFKIIKSKLSNSKESKLSNSKESKLSNLKKIRNQIRINTECDNRDTIVNRTEIMASQISPIIKEYFNEDIALADIGCGDGMVPYYLINNENIKVNKPVLLTDVVHYLNKKVENDDFYHFIKTDSEQWPADILKEEHEAYNVILLLTVLHHSTKPTDILSNIPELLKENGLLLVIESSIKISSEDVKRKGKEEKEFATFSYENQVLYATFIDWFYNKLLIFNHEVPVPFNFTRHNQWKTLIEEYGLKQEKVEMLGFDQKLAPEFHTLHVFKKT